MSNWVRAADLSEIAEGELLGVVVEGAEICLANVDGKVCAVRDQCSHDRYPLSDGELEDGQITCIYHGARFEACSGKNTALPAVMPIQNYPVEVRDGEIFVDLDG